MRRTPTFATMLLAWITLAVTVHARLIIAPRQSTGWVQLGCYSDSTGARTLQNVGYVVGGPSNMSVENCEAGCKSAGYSIAGVEYSAECWCDNQISNGGGPASDGAAQCTMTCNGDPSEMCGGPNRLNVYQYGATTTTGKGTTTTSGKGTTTTTTTTTTPKTTATTTTTGVEATLPAQWTYAGCYEDNVNGLGRSIMNGNPGNSAMTVESCVNLCAGNGYTVAGMEYADECYCDNYVRNGAPKEPETDCNMACAGNANEKCGGPNRLNVYSKGTLTVVPAPVVQTTGLPGSWVYKGCLQDNVNNTRTFPYQIINANNNTATKCLNRCAKYGFGAGGMEYGDECYCGDVSDIGSGVQIVSDAQCNQVCSGNPKYYCGAGNLISYYVWNGTPLQTWKKPTGGAAGLYKFLIGGVVIPLMTTLNINGKVTFLEKWGTGPPNTTGAYEFDPTYSNNFGEAWRAMHVKTDIFCSAGLVLPDRAGRQLTIGGWSGVSTEGIRLYWPNGKLGTNSTNDWQENENELYLQNGRWYPSGMIMANGSILVVGGEQGSNGPPVPTLEILPKVGGPLFMDWLNRTDPYNLYPFMIVLPGGGILAVYYNEARILDQNTFATTKVLPNLPGAVNNDAGGRTYPLEGTLVVLPQHAPYTAALGVLICGGSTPYGGDAIDNCVSINPETAGQNWTIERMPSKRVMTCMAALPDGTFLIVNGAHVGVAGFGLASSPNLQAVLYDPTQPVNQRMSIMASTTIARLYHSEAILMPDGSVLISGSDPEDGVNPQEYRVETFYPPYHPSISGAARPAYTIATTDWTYGGTYTITITAGTVANFKISLLGLVSSTHGNSFGQRTYFPAFSCSGTTCTITAPPNAHVCPPGWFQLFVLDGPTPSISSFVRIGGDPAGLGNWPNFSDFTVPGV